MSFGYQSSAQTNHLSGIQIADTTFPSQKNQLGMQFLYINVEPELEMIITFSLSTGVAMNELFALCWTDINFEKSIVNITKTVTTNTQGKTTDGKVKNRHRFSLFSYAYRNDRNVHFAIQDISVELSQGSRIFVAEFDFSKFFDSNSHKYL